MRGLQLTRPTDPLGFGKVSKRRNIEVYKVPLVVAIMEIGRTLLRQKPKLAIPTERDMAVTIQGGATGISATPATTRTGIIGTLSSPLKRDVQPQS